MLNVKQEREGGEIYKGGAHNNVHVEHKRGNFLFSTLVETNL